MTAVRIREIFYSIQGESSTSGWPTIFIRLTGCPLRCQYCDTSYAFKGGKKLTFAEILSQIQAYQCQRICITGGEPLAQPVCFELMRFLADQGYHLSLETSGAIDISPVDQRVLVVMDLKTPDSAEMEKNLYSNLSYLKPKDQVKFVICSELDYDWAKQQLATIPSMVEVLFSPSWGQVAAHDLADWIIRDQLNVRFQIQLHKILWDDGPGR